MSWYLREHSDTFLCPMCPMCPMCDCCEEWSAVSEDHTIWLPGLGIDHVVHVETWNCCILKRSGLVSAWSQFLLFISSCGSSYEYCLFGSLESHVSSVSSVSLGSFLSFLALCSDCAVPWPAQEAEVWPSSCCQWQQREVEQSQGQIEHLLDSLEHSLERVSLFWWWCKLSVQTELSAEDSAEQEPVAKTEVEAKLLAEVPSQSKSIRVPPSHEWIQVARTKRKDEQSILWISLKFELSWTLKVCSNFWLEMNYELAMGVE